MHEHVKHSQSDHIYTTLLKNKLLAKLKDLRI